MMKASTGDDGEPRAERTAGFLTLTLQQLLTASSGLDQNCSGGKSIRGGR